MQPFGSYANGLSLAASDIDVVITGVTYPDDGRGGAPLTSCPFSSAILLLQSLLWLASTADFAVYCCGLHVAAVPVCVCLLRLGLNGTVVCHHCCEDALVLACC